MERPYNGTSLQRFACKDVVHQERKALYYK